MQADYKVGRCSRRCHLLDRPLVAGEWYYSVVTEGDEEESLERIDISAQAWQGPPEGTVGWWKSRMPQAGPRKLKLAPDPVLIDLLKESAPLSDNQSDELRDDTMSAEEPSSPRSPISKELRYLLALMLIRRRIVQPLSKQPNENELALEIVADGTQVTVQQTRLTTQRARQLDEQIIELLYCDAD